MRQIIINIENTNQATNLFEFIIKILDGQGIVFTSHSNKLVIDVGNPGIVRQAVSSNLSDNDHILMPSSAETNSIYEDLFRNSMSRRES